MNVSQWQRIIGAPQTGTFDSATHEATVQWQKKWNEAHPHDLIRTDGVVDERTWYRGTAASRPTLTSEQEGKWNERARIFVQTFQKVMGDPRPDSLAGLRTFHRLKDLDVNGKLTAEEWAELLKRVQ